MNQKIVAIVGPTASGKTALAIRLAKKYNGEIVSADSRQIYRGMDIGTAKPLRQNTEYRIQKKEYKKKKKEGQSEDYISGGIRHHLLDIKNPDEDYSVADYKRDATRAIDAILKRGKLPILAGGTGLYVKAVIDNLTIPEVKADPRLRKRLETEIKKEGLPAVFQKLIALDPEAAHIVDPKNPRRVIRALEIAVATKKPFSETRKSGPPLYDAVHIGIFPGKEVLEKRIKKRTREMFGNGPARADFSKKKSGGLVKEVKSLVKKYGSRCKTFDGIGYREVIDYLDGKISPGEAEKLINKNTVAYAKRQMTWFKKDKRIRWVKDQKDKMNLGRI